MKKVWLIIPMVCLVCVPPTFAEEKTVGSWLRESMDKVDKVVQDKLEENPQIKEKINKGIDTVADNIIDFATPESQGDSRRIQKDAVQMLLNPSRTERNRSLQDIVGTIYGQGTNISQHPLPLNGNIKKPSAQPPVSHPAMTNPAPNISTVKQAQPSPSTTAQAFSSRAKAPSVQSQRGSVPSQRPMVLLVAVPGILVYVLLMAVVLILFANSKSSGKSASGPFYLGRDPVCRFRRQDSYMSRYHGQFKIEQSGVSFENLSAQGSIVNGHTLICGTVPVTTGTQIQAGRSVFFVAETNPQINGYWRD